MARNFGVLNRVKNQVPLPSLKILYSSLIFTHYSYCLEAWGSCPLKNQKRMKILQKKSIRAICRTNWLSHTEPRMKNLGILKIEDQFNFQCANQIFNMLKGSSPDILGIKSRLNANRPEHSLRSTSNQPAHLRLPASGSMREQSFAHIAPKFWNSLPLELQNATSHTSFKKQLNKLIVSQYAEKVPCSNSRCFDRKHHT